MKIATLIFSALGFVASSASLFVAYKGVKHVNDELEAVKAKTNKSLRAVRTMMQDLEI